MLKIAIATLPIFATLVVVSVGYAPGNPTPIIKVLQESTVKTNGRNEREHVDEAEERQVDDD